MTTEQEWRYDAAQHDPLTAFRLPVIGTVYPRWAYHVAVCVSDDPHLWTSVRPSDAEAAALLIALDHVLDYYYPHYRAQLLTKAPFDLDGGTNTLTFAKQASNGGWQYRRATWTDGYTLMPPWNDEPASLLDVLDRALTRADAWEAKKAQHADTFTHPDVTTVWLPDRQPVHQS